MVVRLGQGIRVPYKSDDSDDDIDAMVAAVAKAGHGRLVEIVASVMQDLRTEGFPADDLDRALAAMCKRMGVSEEEVRRITNAGCRG